MLLTRHVTIRTTPAALAALAALAAVCLLASGCSSDGSSAGAARTPVTASPGGRSVAADSPAVVAAAAVGTRSRAPVISLHALATGVTASTATGGGIPAAEVPRQAVAIRTELGRQITDATRSPLPANSAGSMLVLALRSYQQVAAAVASRAVASTWSGRLAAADDGWTRAMRGLSTQSHRDLLADMPTLAVPTLAVPSR